MRTYASVAATIPGALGAGGSEVGTIRAARSPGARVSTGCGRMCGRGGGQPSFLGITVIKLWTVENSRTNVETTRGYLLCRWLARSRTTPSQGTDSDSRETSEPQEPGNRQAR